MHRQEEFNRWGQSVKIKEFSLIKQKEEVKELPQNDSDDGD
jgi:hypothetical protein